LIHQLPDNACRATRLQTSHGKGSVVDGSFFAPEQKTLEFDDQGQHVVSSGNAIQVLFEPIGARNQLCVSIFDRAQVIYSGPSHLKLPRLLGVLADQALMVLRDAAEVDQPADDRL
jgi:hypothetical protein